MPIGDYSSRKPHDEPGRRGFANRRETIQLPLKPGTPMKIYYLNPPYTDLSIENEVLKATGIELVPATVESEQDVINVAQEAAAILTAHVPINAGIAESLSAWAWGTTSLTSSRVKNAES
jgi:hypothetical protein